MTKSSSFASAAAAYILAAFISSACLTSCVLPNAAPKQLYSGPPRLEGETASVRFEDGVSISFYTIKVQSGYQMPQPIGDSDGANTATLLPGSYKALVTFHQGKTQTNYFTGATKHVSQTSTEPAYIEFTLSAGHHYRAKVQMLAKDKWQAILLDAMSNQVVSKPTKLW